MTKPTRPVGSPTQEEVEGDYKNYADYNQSLRTWLLSYGVGAPVLFASQQHVVDALKANVWGRWPVILFLGGVFVQVSVGLLNKTIAWHNYHSREREYLGKERPTGPLFDFSRKHQTNYCIDLWADVASVTAFVVATAWAFLILTT